MSLKTCPQANLMEAFSQMTLTCIKLIKIRDPAVRDDMVPLLWLTRLWEADLDPQIQGGTEPVTTM